MGTALAATSDTIGELRTWLGEPNMTHFAMLYMPVDLIVERLKVIQEPSAYYYDFKSGEILTRVNKKYVTLFPAGECFYDANYKFQ